MARVASWPLVAIALFLISSPPLAATAPSRLVWKWVGPSSLQVQQGVQRDYGVGPNSGQVTGIAIDTSGRQDQVIYISTNDGGVWKSGDRGASWHPTTDSMPSLSMGAVAVDPGNPAVVYAGTGNGHDPGGTFTRGVGIYRSTDAGASWSQLHPDLFGGSLIERILVPAPDLLLIATSPGVYRSVDGGVNFGSDPPGFRNGQPVIKASTIDLSLDTATRTTVYASAYGLGMVRSTDGGITFPTTLLPSKEGVVFAQSTLPDNRTIYASAGDSPQSWKLLRSSDGGASFQPMPARRADQGPGLAADDGGCACVLNRTIGVDPQDPSRVYVGFRELFRSLDGGTTFANVSRGKIHFDHHALVFSPRTHWEGSPTRLYVGTDGGIATSPDGGDTFDNLNGGIGTSLFYGVDFGRGSVEANGRIYGGTQDNGVDVRLPSGAGQEWLMTNAGDGGPATADPNNPERGYSSEFGTTLNVLVTSDGGQTWATPGVQPAVSRPTSESSEDSEDSEPPSTPGAVNSFPHVAVDSASGSTGRTSSIVYLANGPRLLQTTNADAAAVDQIRFSEIKRFDSVIMALAVQEQVLWVGLVDGSVWRATGARSGSAASWSAVAINGRPALSVGSLAIDGERGAVGYYTSRLGPSNPAQHLYLTNDGGGSWKDVSAGLPDLNVNAVVLDAGRGGDRPHTIIAATGEGVLWSRDDGRSWARLGSGLPPVDVTSLAFDPATSVLLAGTYGRGAYELTLTGLESSPRPAPSSPPVGVGVEPGALATAGGFALLAIVLVVLVRRLTRRPRAT